MKLMYKDKERDSKAFLDVSGVQDKSKMVLIEDPISQEKRLLEMRKIAKTEKISKAISDISLEVDRLGGHVSAFEMVIKKGGKIAEKDIVMVIELLMNELIKLDGIVTGGDVKLQRKMQVKRVQNYVETLDVLKVRNSVATGQQKQSSVQKLTTIQEHNNEERQEHTQVQSLMDMPIQYKEKKREIEREPNNSFDHHPTTPLTLATAKNQAIPRFNWEFL